MELVPNALVLHLKVKCKQVLVLCYKKDYGNDGGIFSYVREYTMYTVYCKVVHSRTMLLV